MGREGGRQREPEKGGAEGRLPEMGGVGEGSLLGEGQGTRRGRSIEGARGRGVPAREALRGRAVVLR